MASKWWFLVCFWSTSHLFANCGRTHERRLLSSLSLTVCGSVWSEHGNAPSSPRQLCDDRLLARTGNFFFSEYVTVLWLKAWPTITNEPLTRWKCFGSVPSSYPSKESLRLRPGMKTVIAANCSAPTSLCAVSYINKEPQSSDQPIDCFHLHLPTACRTKSFNFFFFPSTFSHFITSNPAAVWAHIRKCVKSRLCHLASTHRGDTGVSEWRRVNNAHQKTDVTAAQRAAN